jgi:flagellin
MALGVLNNISAIMAQNNLSNTQASLSKTLQQLSSGSRINSGADDAAGLSLANGLQASSTALTQSAANASEGVDFLQVADGALSQVTSLLNRAVTLATEASNGTLNSSQTSAADSEYQKILTEVNTINGNTEYNGLNVFKTATNTSPIKIFTSDGTVNQTYNSSATDLVGTDDATLGIGNAVTVTGAFKTGTAPADAAPTTNVADASGTNHNVTITFTKTGDPNTFTYAVTSTDNTVSVSGGTGAITFDATTGKETAVTGAPVTYTAQGAGTFSPFSFALDFSKMTAGSTEVAAVATDASSSLTSATSAQNALTAINTAITKVAADRGTIGANINTLTAVENVMNTQSTNTLSAENDVTATDYGQATSDMSKFQILMQTGIAALSQATQSQQLITKLLQ